MDKQTKEILERFTQRLIDNNARSKTYFVGQLKSIDTIDLVSYTDMFNPNIHLSNSIIKHSKISYPYEPIIPTKIVNELLENKSIYINDKKVYTKYITNNIYSISDKESNLIYTLVNSDTIDNKLLLETVKPICEKYDEIKRNKYISLDTLNQTSKQCEAESGRSELYIGYPFIEGTFFSGKVFRAPLLLHKAVFELSPNLKVIKFDEEVYINPVFIISYMVENKMPHQRFEFDLSESKDLIKTTLKYLKDKLALNIDYKESSKLIPFVSSTKPNYEENLASYPGEFKIINNAVIGIFPISTKSIYYDLKNIIENDNVNTLLKNFLSKHHKDTEVNEYFNQNEENETKEDKIEIIGETDITQKMIIKESMFHNVVIEGPPGTGKSQTIVNIISTNVSKGKSILVISEKKTAIDVIYNRLEKLAYFSLIVRNLDSEKASFYKQLIETIDIIKNIKDNVNDSKSRIYTKNRSINSFFESIKEYHDVISKDYDSYSFSDIASSQKINPQKDLYNRVKMFASNYDNFSSIINSTFSSEYLDGYMNLKNELEKFKIYEISGYDIEKIEKFKKLFGLSMSSKSLKYLFNRIYLNLPINDYKVPLSINLKGYKLNTQMIEYYDIVKNEIKDIDLDIFKTNDENYENPEILEFIVKNNLTKEDLEQMYKYYLYDECLKQNKDIFKFIKNYSENEKQLTKDIKAKENLCLDIILNRLINNVVYESNTNRDIFEGIKELIRVASLKRKRSITNVTSKNFNALKSVYPIWLCTPEVASSILPAIPDLFDIVIFDEASQMFVENSVGAIFRAKRAIVVGDTKQLRPSSVFSSRYVEDTYALDSKKLTKYNVAALEEESLLDYATHKYLRRYLRYHYRSEQSNLIEFSSRAFYENQLFFSSSNKKSYKEPLEVIQVPNGQWVNNQNIEEAKYVCDKIIEIMKYKVANSNNDTIGVVTFNEQQRKLISDMINKLAVSYEDDTIRSALYNELTRFDSENNEDLSLFIKNIENVQGDERDIIIFSITYAKNKEGKLNSSFGLLSMQSGENRLNVALTRAKKKIIIIKSFYSYELNINERNNGPYYFKKYLEYAELINKKSSTKELLDSLCVIEKSDVEINNNLNDDLYEKLIKKLDKKKYSLIRNYTSGTFLVDFAIVNNETENIDLLIKGEEQIVSNSTFDNENDYYCDIYLKKRGYNIYRVFSYNYWKNPNQTIKQIIEML